MSWEQVSFQGFPGNTPEDGRGQPSLGPLSWKRRFSCMLGNLNSHQMLLRWIVLLLLTLQGTPYCLHLPLHRGSYVLICQPTFYYCSSNSFTKKNKWINLKDISITPTSKHCKTELQISCLQLVCKFSSSQDGWELTFANCLTVIQRNFKILSVPILGIGKNITEAQRH